MENQGKSDWLMEIHRRQIVPVRPELRIVDNERNAKGPAGSTDYYKILLSGSVFDPSIDP